MEKSVLVSFGDNSRIVALPDGPNKKDALKEYDTIRLLSAKETKTLFSISDGWLRSHYSDRRVALRYLDSF